MPYLSHPVITKKKSIALALAQVKFPFTYLLKSDSQLIFFTDHSIPSFDTSKFKIISSENPLSTLLVIIKEKFADKTFNISEGEFFKWEIKSIKTFFSSQNLHWSPRIEIEFTKKEYFELIKHSITIIHQINLFIYAALRYEILDWSKKKKSDAEIIESISFNIKNYMQKQQKIDLFKPEFYLLKNEEILGNKKNLFSFTWRGEINNFDLGYQSTCLIGSLEKNITTLILNYNNLGKKLKNILLNIADGQEIHHLKLMFSKAATDKFIYNGCDIKRLDGRFSTDKFELNNVYLIKVTYAHNDFPYYFCDVIKIDKKKSVSLHLGDMGMLVFYE